MTPLEALEQAMKARTDDDGVTRWPTPDQVIDRIVRSGMVIVPISKVIRTPSPFDIELSQDDPLGPNRRRLDSADWAVVLLASVFPLLIVMGIVDIVLARLFPS